MVPTGHSQTKAAMGSAGSGSPPFLGARTVDCRCIEPELFFVPFFLFPESTLPREHLISSLLEKAGAALRGDIAAMALGCFSNWSTCQALLCGTPLILNMAVHQPPPSYLHLLPPPLHGWFMGPPTGRSEKC